ncbi:MAG TPA: hypothetical protein VFD76_07050, partial [Gemmatimonadales bacterium]|nr:hypothetical protein [Gemmatimonadales bacterium]
GCELCADERPDTIAAALERVLRRGGRADGGRAAVQELDERVLTQRVIDIYRSIMRSPRSSGSVVEAPHALP